MHTPNERLQELFDRWYRKETSEAETQELMELLHDADQQSGLENLMKGAYDRLQAEPFFAAQQKEQMVDAILKKKVAAKIFTLRRVAAAAAIILLLTTGTFLLLNHQKPTKVATNNEPKIYDVQPPQTARATITLDNGKKLFLDSAGNGTLATEGNVNIQKLGDGQITYTGTAEEVTYNTLTNPRGSKVVSLTLSDGTLVWLNAESSLRYPTAFTGTERKVEITGEGYFEVAHDAGKPFTVNKGETSVQVLGTHFNVNAYEDEGTIKVTLLEGSVKVVSGLSLAIIKPGQQAQVTSPNEGGGKGGINVMNGINQDEVMAWKNGKFDCQDSDLETIMRKLARWYDVEVSYKDRITDRYTVDVSRDVPVSQLFRFIEMSGGVHFEIEGKKIVVKK